MLGSILSASACSLCPTMGLGVALAQNDSPLVAPSLILVMSVIAGLGTILLLPSRRDRVVRGLGGVVLLFTLLILALVLFRAVWLRGESINLYFWIFSAIALIGACAW